MPGFAASPATGACATMRPALPSVKPATSARSCSLRSFERASRRVMPVSYGITPCSGRGTIRVTVS
jgi:hypothetical protein